jgi:hypothetical protein
VKKLSDNGAFKSRLGFMGSVTVYILSNGALMKGSAIVCSLRYKTCLVEFKGLVIIYCEGEVRCTEHRRTTQEEHREKCAGPP